MEMEYILAQNVDKPEDLLICRVCLDTNTKLFNLLQLSICDSFVRFTETPISASDGIPHYICHYCVALLCKALCFQRKCQHAYKLLQDYCASDTMTLDIIQNEMKPKLPMQLAVTPTEKINLLPDEVQDGDSFNTETCDVKEETKDINQDLNFDDTFDAFQEMVPLDIAAENSKEDIKNEHFSVTAENLNIVKTKKVRRSVKSEENSNQDIKNEHCSVTTENLNIVKTKKVRRSGRTKDKALVPTETTEPGQNLIKEPPQTKKVKDKGKDLVKTQKKTRRYNQKLEEDFEAFAKMYNVEVKVLTKEQQLDKALKKKLSIDAQNYLFPCEHCYKGFKSQSAYKKHSVKHDLDQGNHVCDVCKIRFHTKKKMQAHARKHKIEFVCKVCQQVNKSSFTARVHHIFHEGQKFECQYCNKKFNALSSKHNHVRGIHKSLICDICQKTVSGTKAMSIHKKTVHSDTWLQCTKCGVQFQNEVALKRHKCDSALKLCGVCGAGFGSTEELSSHVTEKHQNTVFKCTKCPATFTTDPELCLHMNRSHLQKDTPYMCHICAKSYTNATQLRYHQRSHTGEKPFQCSVCQHSFKHKVQLKIHMNIHTGERPYKCKFCPETFKSYAQRHKHKLMVHTKQRPYKCHLCEKTYVVSYDLKTHIKHTHMHVPRPPRRNRNKH